MRALVAGVALMLCGCAVAKGPEQPRVMRLAPAFAATRPLAQRGTITIAPVMAGGAIETRRYAYVDRDAPKELRQAATLFWDEPPPRMLDHALSAGLAARLAGVTGPEAAVPADQRLVVRLDQFEEQSGGGQPAMAKVAFDATLVATAGHAVGLSARYCGSAPITGTSPSERVTAFEAAVEAAVTGLATDIASARQASDGGC